jgi:CheY-like chemotaxis protein
MTDTASAPKAKILLIDDDKFLLNMYTMKFMQTGYEVHACLSVAEALDVMTNGFTPDAILFDLIMPDMDGFMLLDQLRARKLAPGALKAALSNQSADNDQNHAKDLGADLCLIKASLIPSEVVNIIDQELHKRNAK